MTASTHRKIRKNNRFWVTKINKKGKQPLVAPVVEEGPVLMASTTVGTQANSSDFIFYKGGQSKNTRMSFIIDTTRNPDNNADNTIIIPFTLYTPSYQFTINWGDGTSTTYPANSALTTVGLTHTYSTAGQYIIVITSDKQKIPVLNWSTSGNVGGNKHKLIQLSTPLITFDTACPNSNSAQYFAYECDNLLFIATQFFINNPQIRNYDYCFSKCSKLVKIPYDLFKYVKYQSSYQEVFAHDISLQTVPNDLFATAKAIDLGGAFSGDSNLVLDVDLDTFFGTEPYINVDVHDIFRDCVKTTGDAVEFTKKFTEYVAYVIGTGTFDTGWGTLTGKIYAQPIYNSDGKLVRDLVPAKTGNFYGGRIAPQDCLYDEVNGEFLLPSSTFTYGTEKDVRDSYVVEGGKLVWANPNIKLIKKAGSASYIQTNYDDNTNTVAQIIHSFESEPVPNYNERYTLLWNNGHYNNANYPDAFYYHWWHNSTNGYASWFYVGTSGGAQSYNLPFVPGHMYEAIVSGTTSVNQKLTDLTTGTVLQNYNNTWSFNGGSTAKLRLFNSNTNHTVDFSIHQVKFIEDGVVLNHFVPVPKGLLIGNFVVPSNGMWDMVNQTFYGNAGTGEFEIGGFNLDNIENNLPYSFKKNALYNCEKWSNFAIPESVWTGTPSNRDNWLAVNEGKTNWLLTDSMNMLLLESANSSILCSPTDALKADTEALLSWYTGTLPEQVQGIIKPEPYESVDSLRNIINALPELRGYTVVGNPTIVDGIATCPTYNDIIKADISITYSYDSDVVFYARFKRTNPETDKPEHATIIGNSNIYELRLLWCYKNNLCFQPFDTPIYPGFGNVHTETWYRFKASGKNKIWTVELQKDDGSLIKNGSQEITSGTRTVLPLFASWYGTATPGVILDLNHTYIKVNNKVWFDGTEKLNEVVDLSGCINKGGLTSADLQKVIDKGYTLLLN